MKCHIIYEKYDQELSLDTKEVKVYKFWYSGHWSVDENRETLMIPIFFNQLPSTASCELVNFLILVCRSFWYFVNFVSVLNSAGHFKSLSPDN